MSMAFQDSIDLYKKALQVGDEREREYALDAAKELVHSTYMVILRRMFNYAAKNDDSIIVYGIWSRKPWMMKLEKDKITIGKMQGEDMEGSVQKFHDALDFQRYLKNWMLCTPYNLRDVGTLERALGQLKKIESEKQLRMNNDEVKRLSIGLRGRTIGTVY